MIYLILSMMNGLNKNGMVNCYRYECLTHNELLAIANVQTLRRVLHATALNVVITVIGYCFTVHVIDARGTAKSSVVIMF